MLYHSISISSQFLNGYFVLQKIKINLISGRIIGHKIKSSLLILTNLNKV